MCPLPDSRGVSLAVVLRRYTRMRTKWPDEVREGVYRSCFRLMVMFSIRRVSQSGQAKHPPSPHVLYV
jgi:hypothetical protein